MSSWVLKLSLFNMADMTVRFATILIFLYFFLVSFPLFIGINLMNYNFIINFIFLLFFISPYLAFKPRLDIAIHLFVLFIIITTVLFFTSSSLKFYILEFNKLSLPLLAIAFAFRYIKTDVLPLFRRLMFIYVLGLFFLSVAEYPYWGVTDYRFMGLVGNVNLTSNILMLFAIFEIEFLRIHKSLTLGRFFFVLVVFFYFMLLTGTRSALIALFYFLFVFFKDLAVRRCFSFIILFILGLVAVRFSDLFLSQLRFDAEASNITRIAIYQKFWNLIVDNYLALPMGLSAHEGVMDVYFRGFAVHNDILQYLYNLGIGFMIYCSLLFYSLRRFWGSGNFRVALIFFLFLSTALHNELFSIYVWVPLLFILLLFKFKVGGLEGASVNR